MADQNPNETPFQAKMRRMQQALAELQARSEEWSRRADGTAEEWARWGDDFAEKWSRWGDRQADKWSRWGDRQAKQWSRLAERHARHVSRAQHHAAREYRREEKERWREEKERRREEKKRRRREAKRRRRELHGESGGRPEGFVFALIAAAAVVIALSNPRALWWLIFVALGFGQAAARLLSRGHAPQELPERGQGQDEDREQHQEGQRDQGQRDQGQRDQGRERPPEPRRETAQGREPAPPSPANEADTRVDAVCDKLLAEVRNGPNILREVVRNPEQTVEALRKSCHDLSRRERELRALYTPEDERRLASERDALSARIEAEQDEVARGRLKEALAALDAQRGQRAELATAAARLGAEHTRLYYTLENLYAQVLRVRSADAASADVAGAGLRKSIEQLGDEMDAVAEAIEAVHRDDAHRMDPISDIGGGEPGGGRSPGGRERV